MSDMEKRLVTADQHCRVYWGSHGCHLPRGHDFPLHMCGFGDPGGPHAFHDGKRSWLSEYSTDGEDDPPTGMTEAYEGLDLFGEDAPQ